MSVALRPNNWPQAASGRFRTTDDLAGEAAGACAPKAVSESVGPWNVRSPDNFFHDRGLFLSGKTRAPYFHLQQALTELATVNASCPRKEPRCRHMTDHQDARKPPANEHDTGCGHAG